MYVNFEYYSNTYKGKVIEEDFTPLRIKAEAVVDFYTFNRIKVDEVTDNIKFAVCELIDALKEKAGKNEENVLSEKVGSYAVTYASAEEQNRSFNRTQKAIILKYLPSELLYRGVSSNAPVDFETGG